jgi:hypothetical protein
MIWLIAVAYAIPALVCFRMLAGHIAWRDKFAWSATPDSWDWTWGCFCAVAPALVWPLLALWRVLHFPRFRWVVGAEREGRAKADAQRLEDRERELGLL